MNTQAKVARHGESRGVPEYYVWEAMIRRCHSKTHPQYYRYGGRGIRVCRRWRNYLNFLDDMGRRPSSEHSIERIDNDGNYEPRNCKWATIFEQSRNTRRNRFITANGETLTHTEWAKKLGAEASAVRDRIRRGWTEMDAVSVPINQNIWRRRRAK